MGPSVTEGVGQGEVHTRSVLDSTPGQLGALFEDRFASMVRLATLLTGSVHTAEEVVMDAFTRLAGRLDEIDEPAAYLRTSVVNGTRSHHRRQATVRRQPTPRPQVVHDPEVEVLWQRLDVLRPDERACVVLRYYLDLPLAEIATQLDLPLGTVKSHVHRALAQLRELLSDGPDGEGVDR